MSEPWVEMNIQSDGISVTIYDNPAGPGVKILDETWLTWDEVDAIREANGSGTITLNR